MANKKIDLFVNGEYWCSTIWHMTCKSAVANMYKALKNEKKIANRTLYRTFLKGAKITAHFSK